MISEETATDIAVIYRDIRAAEELLAKVKAELDRHHEVDIRDVFGRRHHALQLGILSGERSHTILHVPYSLAVPVIEATIASHRAKLGALDVKARAELFDVPASNPAPAEEGGAA